jgi:hypothetical protein
MNIRDLLNTLDPYLRKIIRTTAPGIVYGGMSADDANVLTVVAAADVYYGINSGFTAMALNGMTFESASKLRCEVAGTYVINWSMSIYAGNNDHIEGTFMVNGVADEAGSNAAHTPGPGDEVGGGGAALVALAVGDLVQLCVENEADADDITMTHATMTVMMVGE